MIGITMAVNTHQRKEQLRLKHCLHCAIFTIILTILLSSFLMIYVKDSHRRLFVKHQILLAEQQVAVKRYSQLVLEQSTWSSQSRVHLLAQNNLGMRLPDNHSRQMLTSSVETKRPLLAMQSSSGQQGKIDR